MPSATDVPYMYHNQSCWHQGVCSLLFRTHLQMVSNVSEQKCASVSRVTEGGGSMLLLTCGNDPAHCTVSCSKRLQS